MRNPSKAIVACLFGMALVSCAPKPAPLEPEPLFDKYGEVIVTNECRPSSQPISPNYPDRLPVCEERCPPGTQPGPPNAVAAAPERLQCVPIPDDDDDNQRGQNP